MAFDYVRNAVLLVVLSRLCLPVRCNISNSTHRTILQESVLAGYNRRIRPGSSAAEPLQVSVIVII